MKEECDESMVGDSQHLGGGLDRAPAGSQAGPAPLVVFRRGGLPVDRGPGDRAGALRLGHSDPEKTRHGRPGRLGRTDAAAKPVLKIDSEKIIYYFEVPPFAKATIPVSDVLWISGREDQDEIRIVREGNPHDIRIEVEKEVRREDRETLVAINVPPGARIGALIDYLVSTGLEWECADPKDCENLPWL